MQLEEEVELASEQDDLLEISDADAHLEVADFVLEDSGTSLLVELDEPAVAPEPELKPEPEPERASEPELDLKKKPEPLGELCAHIRADGY